MQNLLQELKIDKATFMNILDEVCQADDRSMKFAAKNRNYRHGISTIVYVLYEKLAKEIANYLAKAIKIEESALSLGLVEFCGFRNKTENGYDDLHVNYLNERMLIHYADSIISFEKKIYDDEGLGSKFPSVFDFKGDALKVVKLIDNVRSPPGIYQILETANKLSKNNDQLVNDIIKFLKTTNLVLFEKGQKQRADIKHTFGDCTYIFSDFVEKNKYYLSPVYKELFAGTGIDFINRHDLTIDSTNKFYKSDIYKHLLTNFLAETRYDNSFFLNCINYQEEDLKEVIHQFDVFKLVGLVNLLKNLYPIKIPVQQFCAKYIELLGTENRSWMELTKSYVNFNELAERILDYQFYGKKRADVLFGRSKIFLSSLVVAILEEELEVVRTRLEKWKEYLTIKCGRFLKVVRKKRFLQKVKKDKAVALFALTKLKVKYVDQVRFHRCINLVKWMQRRVRQKGGLCKLRKAFEVFKVVKERIRGLQLRFRFKFLRRKIVLIQRKIKQFLFRRRLTRYMWLKKLVKNLANRSVDIRKEKVFQVCVEAIARKVKQKMVLRRHKNTLKSLQNYLIAKLKERLAVLVQKNWKSYVACRNYSMLKEATIVIQKNMIMFMWRKNYKKLREGMIQVQRLWRKKRWNINKDRYKKFLYESKVKSFIKDNTTMLLEKLIAIERANYERRLEAMPKLRVAQKHPRPHNFSYIVDIDISEDLDDMGHVSLLNFFEELYKTFSDNNEQLLDIKPNNSHVWVISTKFNGYCWGNCAFMPGKTKSDEINAVEFCGSKPNFIEAGDDFTAFQYTSSNEIKFMGTFDIFGSSGSISKTDELITTKFNQDFEIKQISVSSKTVALLSDKSEILCWPFYNPDKGFLTRLRINMPEKIVEVAAGLDFVVMRANSGSVFCISNSNSCGELGNGTFNNDKRLQRIVYFNELGEHVSQISVGFKHIIALTIKNNIYGWGSNFKGQLGKKHRLIYPYPRLITIKHVVKKHTAIQRISAGKFCSFAMLKDQKVYFWGTDGTYNNIKAPIEYLPRFNVI